MTLSRKPIVVVGSINMDLCARVPRLPVAGETLTGDGFETTPGGKGANQAVAAARLDYPVSMIGNVGASGADGGDVFGKALVENLARMGVRTDAIERVGGPSGIAQILVAESGENMIVVIPGANGKLSAASVDRHAALLRGAGMVLCQLEVPMATILHTLTLCAEAHVPVMLDPAPAMQLPDAAWSQITWFTPNEREAAFYLGKSRGPDEDAKCLLARGVRGVVLKRGSEGAYLATATGEAEWVRPFKVPVVDTVAAGDCFNGAFAVGLLEGLPVLKAAELASAASAICVTRAGAQRAMPTMAEVRALMQAQ